MRMKDRIIRVVARKSSPGANGRSESGHVSGFVVSYLLEAAASPGREASLNEGVLIKLGKGARAREMYWLAHREDRMGLKAC